MFGIEELVKKVDKLQQSVDKLIELSGEPIVKRYDTDDSPFYDPDTRMYNYETRKPKKPK